MDRRKDIAQELKEMNSPLAEVRPFTEPFKIPPGYFEKLPAVVREKIEYPEIERNVRMFPKYLPRIAAAIMFLALLIGVFGYFNRQTGFEQVAENYIIEFFDEETLVELLIEEMEAAELNNN